MILDDLYNIAEEEWNNEHYASVYELLTVYLKYDHEDKFTWITYGNALSFLGRYNESKEIFLSRYDLINEKDKPYVERRIGDLFYECGESEEAEKWFNLASRDKKIVSEAHYWLIRGWNLRWRDNIKAEEFIRKAVKCQDVNWDDFHFDLSAVMIAQKKYDEARRILEHVLKLNPDEIYARVDLEKIQNVDMVLKKIQKIKDKNILYKLANDEKEKKHEAAVIELLEVYIKYKPNHGRAWHIYGDSLRLTGKKEAKQAYLNALMLLEDEYKSIVKMGLAEFCKESKDIQEADKWFEEAMKDKDYVSMGWVWVHRGSNYLMMNNFIKAEECFKYAILLKTDEMKEVYFNLGIALRAQRKYKEAKVAFEQALQISTDYSEAKEALISIENVDNVLVLIDKFQTKRVDHF